MVAELPKPESMADLQDFEEAEETLSLCDLPLYNDGADGEDYSEEFPRLSSSSDKEFFEFSSDFSKEMFPEEDIIFCGKLIPCKETLSNQSYKPATNKDQTQSFSRRKSESFQESQSSQFMSNSGSLTQKNLQRFSSSKTSPVTATVNGRDLSDKRLRKCDSSAPRGLISAPAAKPRWHQFMFGLVKFSPEMELKDIKKRQSRRNPVSMFPAMGAEEEVSVSKSRGKGSWGLLRALGCKGNVRALVKASFGCMPVASISFHTC